MTDEHQPRERGPRTPGRRGGARPRPGVRAVAAIAALALAGCAAAAPAATPSATPTPDAPAAAAGEVTFASIGWDEEVAVTALSRLLLETAGVESSTVDLDAGGIYQGLADGSHDVFVDAWLPHTHADYMAEHGAELERLAVWLDEAPLRWAVPAYVGATSIADLPALADELDGTVTGIEPSAGLMRISVEEVLPAYGLGEDFVVREGSTSSMLLALDRAIRDREPIVVTLWEPHWVYAAYELRNLEDPEGALGEPDEAVVLARPGFTDEHPQAAALLAQLHLEPEQIAALENELRATGEGAERAGVLAWLGEPANEELVAGWLTAAGVSARLPTA